MGESLFRVGHDVELWRVVLFLTCLVAFVLCVERGLHHAEHSAKDHPKSYEMLRKIYRELMILGLMGLCVKMVDALDVFTEDEDKNMLAFKVADLTIFLVAVALIIQAVGVYGVLRFVNMQAARHELVNTTELLELIKVHHTNLQTQSCWKRLWPCANGSPVSQTGRAFPLVFPSSRYDDMVIMRVLRHYFLQTHKLPELFPFARYLHQAQDNQITHMIEVDISVWVFLLVIAWGLEGLTIVVEKAEHEGEQEAILSSFLIFTWTLVFIHFLLAHYLSSTLRKLLIAAGYKSHKDMVPYLTELAGEESDSLAHDVLDDVVEKMRCVQDAQEAAQLSHQGEMRKRHRLIDIGPIISYVTNMWRNAKSSEKEDSRTTLKVSLSSAPNAQTATSHASVISRRKLRFVVKLTLMFNGFFMALMCQCLIYETDKILERDGVVPLVLVPLSMLINMVIFQPQICRNFVLVSCIATVDVRTLSDVISHFCETIQLRSELVACLMDNLKLQQKTKTDVLAACQRFDRSSSGFIEIDDLRVVLRQFGVQVSFYRFNSVARVLFQLQGTRLKYEQLDRLLTLAEQEDATNLPTGGVHSYRQTVITAEVERTIQGLGYSTWSSLSSSEDVYIMARASHDFRGSQSLFHSTLRTHPNPQLQAR